MSSPSHESVKIEEPTSPLLAQIGEFQSKVTHACTAMNEVCEGIKSLGAIVDAQREMARRRMGCDDDFEPQTLIIRIRKSGGRYIANYPAGDVPRSRSPHSGAGLSPVMALQSLVTVLDKEGELRQ